MNDELLDAHMRSSFDRADRVSRLIRRLAEVHGLGSDAFVAAAVELLLAAQEVQVLAAWTFLAEDVASRAGGVVLDVDVPLGKLIGAATHDGTPLETVYRRFAPMVDELVADGVQQSAALTQALDEAAVTARTDVLTAGRKAEQAYGAADSRVIGWRRVPNTGACKWCKYIATQRYHVSDLAPAHRDCHCGTRPIVDETADLDRQRMRAELAEIKASGVPKRYGQRKRDARRANRALDEDTG